MEALEETWKNLQKIIRERDTELAKEATRQEANDKLRKEFAMHANDFHSWLTEARYIFFFNLFYIIYFSIHDFCSAVANLIDIDNCRKFISLQICRKLENTW